MKKVIMILVLAALAGCRSHYASYNSDRVPGMPHFPPTENVEVYFQGEKLPDNKYIKLAYLETNGSHWTKFSDMIGDLTSRAKQAGANAILIQNLSNPSIAYDSERDKVISNKIIYGIAVRFIDKETSEKNYKYREIFYDPGNRDDNSVLFAIEYYPDGSVRKVTDGAKMIFYEKYIEKFDLYYLIDDKPGWNYQVGRDGMINRRMKAREEKGEYMEYTYVDIFYSGTIPDSLAIERNIYSGSYYNGRHTVNSSVSMEYNDDKMLVQKIIHPTDGIMYLEKLRYDALGAPLGRDFYVSVDGSITKLMESEIEYREIGDMGFILYN